MIHIIKGVCLLCNLQKQQSEQNLDTISVFRVAMIDMFYRQIILNNGILLSLKVSNNLTEG